MLIRDRLFGAVVAVLGLLPMAVYASADCEAADGEPLVAPFALFSPAAALLEKDESLQGWNLSEIFLSASPFNFKLMSPVLDNVAGDWHMPAGRYWFSLEVSEAKVTQEGIGIPADDIESWLFAPVDSLAVPF